MLYELSTHCKKIKNKKKWILHSWFAPKSRHWRQRSSYCRWSAYFSWSIIHLAGLWHNHYCTLLPDRTRISLEWRKGARPLDPYTRTVQLHHTKTQTCCCCCCRHSFLQLSRRSLTIHAMTCAPQLALPESRRIVHGVCVCDLRRSLRCKKIALYSDTSANEWPC